MIPQTRSLSNWGAKEGRRFYPLYQEEHGGLFRLYVQNNKFDDFLGSYPVQTAYKVRYNVLQQSSLNVSGGE